MLLTLELECVLLLVLPVELTLDETLELTEEWLEVLPELLELTLDELLTLDATDDALEEPAVFGGAITMGILAITTG